MTSDIKWLLVGAGDIARKRVAPALATAAHSRLVAVCDIRADQARSLAQQFQAGEIYDNYAQALAHTSADAVYIASPVGLHVPQAMEALRAGKHVLVEKPLGLNSAECRPVVQLAEQSGVTAGCAYFRRLFPRYQHARDLLKRDEFGRIVLVRMVYFTLFNPQPDDPKYWRVVRSKSGGGPLSDMGTHMFDVLIGLFGLPTYVYAKCANLIYPWEVEDSAALLMTLANGALVTASFHWNCNTWRHEFEIVGANAKLQWLPYDSGPVIKTAGRQTENLDLPSVENVHRPLVEDFVAAIRENRPPAVPLAEAMKTNILLDAVYQSARENREVALTV